MIPLDISEIKDIVSKNYGIKIARKEKTKIDTPDSAMYLIIDEYRNRYVLRESDYLSGLDSEKDTIEKELGLRVAKWVPLLLPNQSVSRDEKYIAGSAVSYILALVL